MVKPQPLIPQSPGCHPAYDPCLPITGDLNCGDLSTSQKPVRVKDPTNDPYELDREHDGTGCED
ncbi:MAG: excalibur calcium-binding domain-containing protein [Actinobacteria bacterium]|nr:excalibur calcium-binding domain-containing protein [Actinomycetota bacterium]